jgi:hypothetical protein
MKSWIIIVLAAAMTYLGGHSTVIAADGRSLAHVAASVADALAANDSAMLQKYWITYEEAAAVSPQKVRTQSDFIQAKAEWKKLTDSSWREIREAKVLVHHVKIEEVRIRKVKGVMPDRYRVVAVAVPVFSHKGELMPVPMMAMYFVQVGEEWKYAFR